jgi:hypothetical protein
MLEDQNYKCKCCGINLQFIKHCIDHDHKTRKIRAILCDPCNLALGIIKESEEKAKNLLNYILFCKQINTQKE